MSFVYTTGLDKIRNMSKRIKVIPGGSSAGKTYAILAVLIDKCATTPNLSVSVVSESFPHLRKGSMRDFLNVMKNTGRYIDSHWNRTNSIYNFHNGSYIEFFGADSGDKLRGARRNVLYINECNNVNKEVYIQLAMRTDKDIFLDYNPSNKFWIDDVLESDEAEKLILTYKDNEALSDNVVKFLEEKRILALTSEYWALGHN
jgi:phage terminase large subunit